MAKHNIFKDLATYALTCFIAPEGNAIVERIFSLVTAIKTKTQLHKTQIKLLDALERIRSLLLSNAIRSKDHECTANMIKLHNIVDQWSE